MRLSHLTASRLLAPRMDFQRNGLTLRWETLGEDINLIAMLTGFYDLDKPRPNEVIKTSGAATT